MNIRRGGNGLLLIELLIALMFFSLAAAICLQLFIGAHNFSEEASNKSRAAIEAQNIAECFKAADGEIGETARLLDVAGGDGSLTIWYDKDWNRAIMPPDSHSYAGNLVFCATLRVFDASNGLIRATLEIRRDENTLIEFDVAALEVAS